MQSELTVMIDTYTLIGKHCMAKNTGPSMFYLTLTELLEKKNNEYDDVRLLIFGPHIFTLGQVGN